MNGDSSFAGHAKLQGLLKELICSHDDKQLSEIADSALQLVPSLPSLDREDRPQRTISDQLHSSAIALWNRSVALKSAGTISLSLNAQMRHVACSLVLLCNALQPSASVFIKQMTMATKTGRAWLDCDNHSMAETSLQLATEVWEKLRSQYPADTREEQVSKTFFKLLCFRAEAAVGQEQHEAAMGLVGQAREMLHSLESEAGYLAMLCYNIGLDLFQKTLFQHSVSWLRESYEVGRGCSAVGAVKQGRTLRLMANAYLEWDSQTYWQRALNAVGLANSEHSHPAGLLLKTTILLHHGRDGSPGRLEVTLLETLRHPDLSVTMAISTIRQCMESGRSDHALSGVRELSSRYHGTPHLAQVRLLHLELLLGNQQLTAAKELVEDIITADNTGEPLDIKSRKQFHFQFWERAAAAYERSEFAEALAWYNYSLSLFSSATGSGGSGGSGGRGGSGVSGGRGDKNLGRLQRNRCACLISLDELEKAADAVAQAIESDPRCPYGHFLSFKLSVLQGREEDAMRSLGEMVECENGEGEGEGEGETTTTGLVCLAAQMAFERSHRVLATAALEKVIVLSSHSRQVFTALRCLIRLKLTFLNETPEKLGPLHSLISYIHSAETRLSRAVERNLDEAGWFMKVAWNLALQCGENHREMADLFSACYKLSQYLVADQAVLVRRKTCQLMAAAARLHQARETSDDQDKAAVLEEVLEHVSECHSICQLIGTRTNDPSDPTTSILCMYEFEAKHTLGRSDSHSILERLSAMANPDPKTFETIAALAMQGPQKGRGSAVDALKWSIHYHLLNSDPDWGRLSKCYHSHVQLVMEGEKGGDRVAMETAWAILEEVVQLLETRAHGAYPEMEVLWLLTKTWNCGIHQYSVQQYREAERWCSMGMKFLTFLTQLKPSYEDQMVTVYSEVLAKVQAGPELQPKMGVK